MVWVTGHNVDTAVLRAALIMWGQHHFRQFPWRATSDPYSILVAEVMLHRTQAVQVVPVYEAFIRRYPDALSVAAADTDEIMHLLYPLGLHWRSGLIHSMAEHLMMHYGGQIPHDRDVLLSLPGVSDYVASAVRCFAWNESDPLVDTNTVRVIGRVFGLPITESSRRNRHVRSLISGLVDPLAPKEYNHALLDLADRVCTRKREPKCTACPIAHQCIRGLVAVATD